MGHGRRFSVEKYWRRKTRRTEVEASEQVNRLGGRESQPRLFENARNTPVFAYRVSVQRFAARDRFRPLSPVAPAFGFSRLNDTRNVTRRERLGVFSRQKLPLEHRVIVLR